MANQYRSVLASSGPAPTGGDAVAANVLAGKTFTNDNGPQTGTMPNRGAVTQTLSGGQSYTITEGYHNGSGVVTALSSGYDIIDFKNVRTVGSTYNDITVTADVGDYLVLNNSDSNSTISGPTYIEETSEISIAGALKIYKVVTAMSSASIRVLMAGGNGGSVLQIRRA